MKINSTTTWTVFSQTYEATRIIASLFKSFGFCKLLSVYFKLDSYLFDTVLVAVVRLSNVWCIPCLQNGKATDMAADHCIGHAQNSWA